MKDIKNFNNFKKIEQINKGWSHDKKFYVETTDGKRQLLRISDIDSHDRKKLEFEMMKRVVKLSVPMPVPLDFGVCENGKSTYSLFSWCNGDDAEKVLPNLTVIEQYSLGLKYGELLKKIHSIPAPANEEDWESKFNRKIDKRIKKYENCELKISGGDKLINYINENRHLLKDRPQCFQHRDYHVGNMVIDENKKFSIIDFHRLSFGDPWEEFHRIIFSARVSPHFATGQVDGYFDGIPPIDFFKLMALYISSNATNAICWAMDFGENEINTALELAESVLEWFESMENPIPTWYLGDGSREIYQ